MRPYTSLGRETSYCLSIANVRYPTCELVQEYKICPSLWSLLPCSQLYFSTIAICCSLYLLAQIVRMFAGQCKGVGYLLVGGAVGGVSLWLFYAHLCWLCLTFGVWSIEVQPCDRNTISVISFIWSFCPQGVWYYGSDAAMFFIFLYAWRTRTRSEFNLSYSVSIF